MHNTNNIKQFISWGLDMEKSTADQKTPLHYCFINMSMNCCIFEPSTPRFHDFLLSNDAYNDGTMFNSPAELKSTMHWFPTPDVFRVLQPKLVPDYYEQSILERLDWIDPWWGSHEMLLIGISQDRNWTTSHMEELQNHGVYFLAIIAIFYGNSGLFLKNSRLVPPEEVRVLTRDVVAATSNLSPLQDPKKMPASWRRHPGLGSPWRPRLFSNPKTPLFLILQGLFKYYPGFIRDFRRQAASFIQCWLEDLIACGVDLDAYGTTEHQIFCDHTQLREIRYPQKQRNWVRLSGFDFGPTPKDWVFHWDVVPEDYVGDFWYSIENPPLSIPGGWVDEDSDAYDSDTYYQRYDSTYESDSELGSELESEWESESLDSWS